MCTENNPVNPLCWCRNTCCMFAIRRILFSKHKPTRLTNIQNFHSERETLANHILAKGLELPTTPSPPDGHVRVPRPEFRKPIGQDSSPPGPYWLRYVTRKQTSCWSNRLRVHPVFLTHPGHKHPWRVELSNPPSRGVDSEATWRLIHEADTLENDVTL